MASLKSEKIIEVLRWIDKNQMLIPVFQRKYVWKPNQIEALFDSIMKDYPIGTFLFWSLNGDLAKKHTFYKFLNNYHEMFEFLINDRAKIPNAINEVYSVVDGQQRLSSIYFGLKGYIQVKKPKKRKGNPANYEKKYLFLNLLTANKNKDFYEFKFLNENGLEKYNYENNVMWFKVSDIMSWEYDEIEDEFDELCTDNNIEKDLSNNQKKLIKQVLRKLYRKIFKDVIIGFFVIQDTITNTEKLLDIFITVNSKGSNLKKNDLLFSTLTASWNEARDEIQNLVKELDEIDPSFYSEDFILRCCLVLSDSNVLFNPEGFDEGVVEKIKSNWEKIKISILDSAILLSELNFNDSNIRSKNVIIPVIYFIYKDGTRSNESKNEIKQYLIRASLKKVFGSHGDTLLQKIREGLKENLDKTPEQLQKFKWEWINNSIDDMHDKSLVIYDLDIDRILKEKDKKISKLILEQIIQSDKDNPKDLDLYNLFPGSHFKGKKLNEVNLPDEQKENWDSLSKELPNKFLSNDKGDNLIKIMNLNNTLMNQELKTLDFPPDFQTYNLSKFEKVFNYRKNVMKQKLEQFFENK